MEGSYLAAIICTILYLSGSTLKLRDRLQKNRKLKWALICLLALLIAGMFLLVIL